MRIKKKYLIAVSVLMCIMALVFYAQTEEGHALIRKIRTYKNCALGVISADSIQWCEFPISLDLDKGGVPFSIQDSTHPSFTFVPGGWNGYDCWIALTPYPTSLPTSGEPYENTCIYYSNRESSFPVSFSSIKTNPIILKAGAKYNSDPDLFFSSNDSLLYAITRKRFGADYTTRIVEQHSDDGETWSSPNTLFDSEKESLCPCIVQVSDSLYRIYTFNGTKKRTKEMEIWESSSMTNTPFVLTDVVNWESDICIWHGDILQYVGRYYLIGCGRNNQFKTITGSQDEYRYMWLGISEDGLHFKLYNKPVLQINGVYRSTFDITKDGRIVIYFSVHGTYWGDKEKYPDGNRIGKVETDFTSLIQKLEDDRIN